MIGYDLFLCDYDGTLARADGTVSEKNRAAVARYRAAGGRFVLCTGRGLSAALPCCKALGISEGPLCILQGAAVVELSTGELWKENFFSRAEADRLLRVMEARDWHIHVYTLDRVLCNRRDQMLEEYERVTGVRAEIVAGERMFEKVARENLRVAKALVMMDPSEHASVRHILEHSLGKGYYLTDSAPWFAEVLPAGQNKGAGLRFLSEKLHIPSERIAAIGDQENDLPMLEAAGGKFTVKNGAQLLKKIAIEVPSNEEDGVAYTIGKYVMGDGL